MFAEDEADGESGAEGGWVGKDGCCCSCGVRGGSCEESELNLDDALCEPVRGVLGVACSDGVLGVDTDRLSLCLLSVLSTYSRFSWCRQRL